jgi:hypothetical protein
VELDMSTELRALAPMAVVLLTAVGLEGCGTNSPDDGVVDGVAGAGGSGGSTGGGAGVTSRAGAGGVTEGIGGTTAGSRMLDGSADPVDAPARDAGSIDAPTSSDGGDLVITIQNGVFWNDTSGKRIESHGGGFLKVASTWYWVGEDMSQNSSQFRAINVYASTDLSHWEFRHPIITRATAPGLNTTGRVIERPHIIYNDATKKYVMWVHWEGPNYADAEAGVFQCDTIDGDYAYVKDFRPNNNMSRDDTLFKDDDGTAYFMSAGNNNADAIIYQLTSDYLDVAKQVANPWPGAYREGLALFKVNGRYFLVSSTTTGWDPNQAKYATATSMAGPWSALQIVGDSITYDTQPTDVMPLQGSQATTYVYVGDRWQDPDLVSSKYIWLPLTVNGTTLRLDNFTSWKLNLTTGAVVP